MITSATPRYEGLLPTVATEGGSLYVSYWLDYDHFLVRSDDFGATFTSPVRVNAVPGFAHGPVMAVAGNAVYVAWTDERGPNRLVYFNRSLDRGQTFLPQDVKIDSVARVNGMYVPRIEIGLSRIAVHVSWRYAGYYGGSSLIHARSLDGGLSWSPPAIINKSPWNQGVTEFFMSVDNDVVGFFWLEVKNLVSGSVPLDLYVNSSIDSGATFLPSPVKVNHRRLGYGGYVEPIGMEVRDHHMLAAWFGIGGTTGSTGSVFFNRSTDAGASWLPKDLRVDTGLPPYTGQLLNTAYSPAGALARFENSAYLAWMDRRDASRGLYFNIPYGAQPYGSGRGGTGGGVPTLTQDAARPPWPGESLRMDLDNGLGGAVGVALLGRHGEATTPLFGGTLVVAPPFDPDSRDAQRAHGVCGRGRRDHRHSHPPRCVGHWHASQLTGRARGSRGALRVLDVERSRVLDRIGRGSKLEATPFRDPASPALQPRLA